MISLKAILESTQLIAEGTRPMNTYGEKAEDHIGKYLQPEHLKTLSYEMARDSGGAFQGDKVRIRKVEAVPTMNGKVAYHAHIVTGRGKKAKVPLGHILKPAELVRSGGNNEREEDAAVENLHNSIRQQVTKFGGTVKIRHMGKVYHVAGARKVVKGDYPPGRKPKGDIILHGANGEPLIFLSHKAGPKATDAQNYEGTSNHTEHPQVAKFVEDLKKEFPNGLTNKQSFTRKITTTKKADKTLHRNVMFGSDSETGEYGVNNVHSIAHGAIGIKPSKKGEFELTSDKFINNDETFNHNDNAIELTARYMKGRTDNGIQNARMGIARVGSRPSSKEF